MFTLLRSKTKVVQNYCVSYVKRKMTTSRKFTDEQEKIVICEFAKLGSVAKVRRTFSSLGLRRPLMEELSVCDSLAGP